MRKLLFFGLLCALSFGASAQQDAMFSQYLYNMLAINPAYAGSRDLVSTTLFYRNQWTGFDGAPVTVNASAHSPITGTSGSWGFNVMNDKIGVMNQSFVNGSYAYRILTPKGNLSFGINGGFYNYSYNWNKLNLANEIDPIFAGSDNVFTLNTGAGIYYQSKKMALGFSAPHIINHKIVETSGYKVAKPMIHYFATASYLIPLNEQMVLKPSILFKMVQNSPVQADLNVTLIYNKSLYLGVSYRTINEVNLMVQYQLNSKWWFGYAYDIPFSKVGYVSQGSHEIFVGYEFSFGKNKLLSPRYF